MSNLVQIGTMIGRLSQNIGNEIQCFPTKTWKKEFEIAKKNEFDVIEWIFDDRENPITSIEGIYEINDISKRNQIKINSICCDYFMKKPFFNISEFELEKNIEKLKYIIDSCNKLDIKFLEIPLVDSSSIKTDIEEKEFVKNIEKCLSLFQINNVYLTLETDFKPTKFKEFILKFNHPNVVANYDTGNSASLGYNVEEELLILNKFIKNIHIKDRNLGGKTVEFGKGDTNFELFFKTLLKINYSGDLILQGARLDKYLSPEDTCVKYKKIVEQYITKNKII